MFKGLFKKKEKKIKNNSIDETKITYEDSEDIEEKERQKDRRFFYNLRSNLPSTGISVKINMVDFVGAFSPVAKELTVNEGNGSPLITINDKGSRLSWNLFTEVLHYDLFFYNNPDDLYYENTFDEYDFFDDSNHYERDYSHLSDKGAENIDKLISMSSKLIREKFGETITEAIEANKKGKEYGSLTQNEIDENNAVIMAILSTVITDMIKLISAENDENGRKSSKEVSGNTSKLRDDFAEYLNSEFKKELDTLDKKSQEG